MKVGILKRVADSSYGKYIGLCKCGVARYTDGEYYVDVKNLLKTLVCENCKNTFWVYLESHTHRQVFPHLEALEVKRTGFKIKRTNLSVWHDEDYNVHTKGNMIQVLKYDLTNKKYHLYKNGETVNLPSIRFKQGLVDALKPFFKDINQDKFKKMVTTPENETLYDYIYSELSKDYNRPYNSPRKFYKGLVEIAYYPHIEIMANAGFPNLNRFDNYNIHNKMGKNPQEILGLPKFALKYIRENEKISGHDIKKMRKALEKVDNNRFKEMMEIVKDESTIASLCDAVETIIEIHDKYEYKNLKKLTLYLFREIKMYQGITNPHTGATLLRDYIKMSIDLGAEFEKYSKSLKKDHDVTQMNYKVKEDAIKIEKFTKAIEKEEYASLKWKKGDYCVIPPSEIGDLIKEGSELSHCVASYVSSVIEGQCKILFLRRKDNIEKPLATIEVRGNNIRQAKGQGNRSLRKDELDFVAEWSKKKELKLNYYY